jgi:hypothetical protein
MKNSGSEIVISVRMLDSLVDSLPSLMAAKMPRPTDTGMAISAAYPARNKVLPRRGISSSMMTRLLVIATPRSPCSAPQPVEVPQVGGNVQPELLAEKRPGLRGGALPEHRGSHVAGQDLCTDKNQHGHCKQRQHPQPQVGSQ